VSRKRLAQGFALAERGEGGEDGVLAGAVGKDGAGHPEGETPSNGRAQVRKGVEQGAVDLVVFGLSVHGNLRQMGE